MSEILVKTNIPGISKSKNAVVSVDNEGLEAYRRRRKLFSNANNTVSKIEALEKENKDLRKEIGKLWNEIFKLKAK